MTFSSHEGLYVVYSYFINFIARHHDLYDVMFVTKLVVTIPCSTWTMCVVGGFRVEQEKRFDFSIM